MIQILVIMKFGKNANLFLLIVAIASACLSSGAFAAETIILDADNQYTYATARLEAGAFDEAIAEFNRFIHFFPDDARAPRARYLTGLAHFKAGRYEDAAAVFAAFIQNDHGPELTVDAFFMLSDSHARQGMVEQAIMDLHYLISIATRKEVVDKARYELSWLHMTMGQWSRAESALGGIDAEFRKRYGIDDLSAALSQRDRIRIKSPVTAGVLSIFPGAGQMYCGRYQDALVAFLINAGLILSGWEAFDNELYALGGVIGLVELGFYGGNIYGAVSSAHKYNRDQVNAFRQDLNRYREKDLSPAAGNAGSGAALALRFSFDF